MWLSLTGTELVIELPPHADETLHLMDDLEWTEFVQSDRNFETADILSDKVICSEDDDDDDDDNGFQAPSARVVSSELGILLWHRTIQNC